jgi:hypothetical protein
VSGGATLSKDKAPAQRIGWVEPELISAGDECSPPDFWNDRLMRTEGGALHDLHGHGASQNTFDDDGLIRAQLPSRVVKCSTRAHAGACWRPIQLALGEDAHVATMMPGCVRSASKDGAV